MALSLAAGGLGGLGGGTVVIDARALASERIPWGHGPG